MLLRNLQIQKIEFTKQFRKQIAKLSAKKREKVYRTIDVFANDSNTKSLRLHALKGELAGLYSISAGGDLRLHFEFIVIGDIARFVAVGTHAQLYQ